MITICYAIKWKEASVRAFESCNLANSIADDTEDTLTTVANVLSTPATKEQITVLYRKLAPALPGHKLLPKFDTRDLSATALMGVLADLTGTGNMPVRKGVASKAELAVVTNNGGYVGGGPLETKNDIVVGARRTRGKAAAPKAAKQQPTDGSVIYKADVLALHIIWPISPANPRKLGSEGYICMDVVIKNPGLTVAEYLATGGIMRSLKWDVEHGFTRLEDPK